MDKVIQFPYQQKPKKRLDHNHENTIELRKQVQEACIPLVTSICRRENNGNTFQDNLTACHIRLEKLVTDFLDQATAELIYTLDEEGSK